ncbi:MAG TPA: hypothetical protein VEO01_21645 [Pseudonocardiaceae bacterium]|nr:hypothetical protein [Pseudonocardiaceae bacterium]
MYEPAQSPDGRTNHRVLVILAVVVLVGALVAVLVWRLGGRTDTAAPTNSPATTTNRSPAGVQPLAGRTFCSGSIRIYTDTDTGMLRIAQTLGTDSRTAGVFTVTKQESFTQFKREFADQPSLLNIARPEALPAEVFVLPAAHIDLAGFAAQLRTQFPTAQTVDWTPRSPTCPASGQFPPSTPTG